MTTYFLTTYCFKPIAIEKASRYAKFSLIKLLLQPNQSINKQIQFFLLSFNKMRPDIEAAKQYKSYVATVG